MAKTVEQTRLAMNAVAGARPEERRQRLVALFAAGVELRDLVARYHDWLVTEDAWLTANQDTTVEFMDRETRYLERVQRYQEACDVLAAAYETVRDTPDGSVGKAKRPVQAVLDECPF